MASGYHDKRPMIGEYESSRHNRSPQSAACLGDLTIAKVKVELRLISHGKPILSTRSVHAVVHSRANLSDVGRAPSPHAALLNMERPGRARLPAIDSSASVSR